MVRFQIQQSHDKSSQCERKIREYLCINVKYREAMGDFPLKTGTRSRRRVILYSGFCCRRPRNAKTLSRFILLARGIGHRDAYPGVDRLLQSDHPILDPADRAPENQAPFGWWPTFCFRRERNEAMFVIERRDRARRNSDQQGWRTP